MARFLYRYRISRRDFTLAPKVEETLRPIIGGRDRIMETLTFSSDPAARCLLELWERHSIESQLKIPFEAFCLAAKVDIHRMVGILVTSTREITKMKSAMKTMLAHPDIVDSTVRKAKRLDGTKEKEMIHKAVGWLPSPKGSSINLNFGQQAPPEEPEEEVDHTDIDQIFGFDSLEIENWGNQRAKRLESRKLLTGGR